ncbi:endonuclease [Alcanivorax sp. 1008]|uniref:endonuclease n=1 Tax=Alcanivorax sp. 1008 TaxID=2816853 RepID=UPI001D828836|nr:endonuclease [Alcanivorax sp. 1008]MCC1496746.1 endonuclease [Alcanivorax sp. 1008]
MNRNVWIGVLIAVALSLFLMQITAAVTGHRLTPVDAIKELIRQVQRETSESLPNWKPTPPIRQHVRYPNTWTDAKTKMYRIWEVSPRTFYCGCKYESRQPDLAGCQYTDSSMGQRSWRTEAEHIVPASWIGAGRSCWESGRDYCESNDPDFQKAAFDLHNLRPAIGYVNLKRSNYRFGIVRGEPRHFGQCDFEVYDQVVEPPLTVRGDVARVHFYMMTTHRVLIPDDMISMLKRWDQEDPVSDVECLIDTRIEAVQGNRNPYVARGCATSASN